MTTAITPQQRASRTGTYVKWGLGAAAALVVSPVIFLVVKGIAGVVVAGGLAWGIAQYAPVVGMRVKNHRLKLIKEEARKNPVETMQVVLIEKKGKQAVFADKIAIFAGKYKTACDRMDVLAAKFPAEAQKFNEQKEGMKALLTARKEKYRRIQDAIAKFEVEIEKAGLIWDTSMAMQDARQAGADGAEEEAIEKIKVETAIYAVQDQLNTEMAELERDLLDEPEPVKELPAAQPRVVVSNSTVTQDREGNLVAVKKRGHEHERD